MGKTCIIISPVQRVQQVLNKRYSYLRCHCDSIVEVSIRRSDGYSSVPKKAEDSNDFKAYRTFEDVETGTIWAEFAPRRLPWTMAVSLPVLSASRWAEDAFARSCLLCQGKFGYPTLQGGRGVGMATRCQERGKKSPH